MGVFKQLTESGLYTLPFLVHIFDDSEHIYLINDNVSLSYGGNLYAAASFEYSPNPNGDASFECSIFDRPALMNYILRNRKFQCEIVGAYLNNEVVTLGTYKHEYGEAEWDGVKFKIRLKADERGQMTFPALIYNSYNNRGAS